MWQQVEAAQFHPHKYTPSQTHTHTQNATLLATKTHTHSLSWHPHMALTPPIWRQLYMYECVWISLLLHPFPPPDNVHATCQSFYENVKVSNSLELRWECLTVHKCPTLDLHKYFPRPPKMGDGSVGGGEWVVGLARRGQHVCGKHLEKVSFQNAKSQTNVRAFHLSPSRIAEHFPPFMVAILFREP